MRRLTPATISEVRENTAIEAVFSRAVALTPSGPGAWKMLCPWHAEKTPSCTINGNTGLVYCFGCNHATDVFGLAQHLFAMSFPAAVEYLAEQSHIPVEYADYETTAAEKAEYDERRAVLAANADAAEWFTQQLLSLPESHDAVKVLTDRGFPITASTGEPFRVGYAPSEWRALTDHLTAKGHSVETLVAADLAREKDGRAYDRFRHRVMWPIFNAMGQVIGFGGRRLALDESAKYINTSDTVVYKKSRSLYGAHIATSRILPAGEVIIVEGYTDVMALVAGGIGHVLASSGTAWGRDHNDALRPLVAPKGRLEARIVFAFDGDNAGQKAAERALASLPAEWQGGAYACAITGGKDACEIWQAGGKPAVRALFERDVQTPLVQYVLDAHIDAHNTATISGRYDALQDCYPTLNLLHSDMLRNEYVAYVASRTGASEKEIRSGMKGRPTVTPEAATTGTFDPAALDAPARVEWELLKCLAQLPNREQWDEGVDAGELAYPLFVEAMNDPGHELWARAGVEPVNATSLTPEYAGSVVRRVITMRIHREIAELKMMLLDDERADFAAEQLRERNAYLKGIGA